MNPRYAVLELTDGHYITAEVIGGSEIPVVFQMGEQALDEPQAGADLPAVDGPTQSNDTNNSNDPSNLNDTNYFIVQQRCSDPALPLRIINPTLYGEDELSWYSDPKPKIPEPMRLVMILVKRCYLCGDMQSADNSIHQEHVGEHPYGYRFCTDCKPYFRRALFDNIAPIWRFRLQYEAPLAIGTRYERSPVWIARTRYDADTGARIRTGPAPYTYTLWTIVRWVVLPYVDKYRVEHDPTYAGCEDCLIVADGEYTKLVSVKDIFIANYGSIATPAYDPNTDDPLNKYSKSEQTALFELAREAAIFI